MKKEKAAQQMNKLWDNLPSFTNSKNNELAQGHFDSITASLFCPGPFYYYVIDFGTRQIIQMNHNILNILGLDPQKTALNDILNRIHPKDMDFVISAEKICFNFLYNTITPDKITKYKTSYCFRFLTADGTYQLFQHQSLALSTDEENKIILSMNIHTNINHITQKNNYKVTCIGVDGDPSYFNIDVLMDEDNPTNSPVVVPAIVLTQTPFSRREQQLVNLLAIGFSSKQIAEKLGISLNTVTNHRKNILKKAECNSVVQLVNKCLEKGWV